MTLPLEHGYPDWARQTPNIDVLLNFDTDANLTVQTTLPTMFVGAMPYLNVWLQPTGARGQWRFEWYADTALTQQINVDTIVVPAGGQCGMHIPVGGPWLIVRRALSAYPNQMTTRITMAMVPRIQLEEPAFQPIIFSVDNAPIGAGATATTDPLRVVPGAAVLSIDTALATWTARLSAFQIGGGLVMFTAMRNAQFAQPAVVYLPASPLRFSFTNTTGAGGNYNAALTCAGRLT